MVVAPIQTEPRYPWVEGFDDAFDRIYFGHSTLLSRYACRAALSYYEPDISEVNINPIEPLADFKRKLGYEAYEDARKYAQGTLDAYRILDGTEVEHV